MWTKLCEVEAPLQISQLLSEASSLASSPLSASSLTSSSCPPFLSKFQELLAQPVSTFNSEKLRRKLLKKETKNKQDKTGGGGKRKDGIEDRKSEREQPANGRLGEGDVRTDTSCDAGVRKALCNDDRDGAEYGRSGGEEGGEREKSADLDGGAFNGGAEELHTEFNTKVFLCNKKAMRQQKRRQSANQSERTDGSNERTNQSEPSPTEICPDMSSEFESSKVSSQTGTPVANQGTKSHRSSRRPRNKTIVHKNSLPELSHTFAVGIDVSLVDFALLLPLHLYLLTSQVNGRVQEACRTIPLVLKWYKRMWDVPCVRRVVSACLEMREVDVSVPEDACSYNANSEESQMNSHLSSSDIQPGVGNLNVR